MVSPGGGKGKGSAGIGPGGPAATRERPYFLAGRFSPENSRHRDSEQQNVEQGISNVEVIYTPVTS
jgi:hypothetical protein